LRVTTTTVLVRSLVRICGAAGAIVAIDGAPSVLAAYGLSASDSADVLVAVRSGLPVPHGLRVMAALPVELPDSGRSATVIVFTTEPAPPAVALPADVLRALAGAIAHEIERCEIIENAKLAAGLVEQLATGIDSLNDAAAIIEWPAAGAEPRILYVNRAFETLLGYRPADAIGATPELLYGPLTDRERIAFMSERVRETFAARMPIVYYRRDGIPLWVEVSLRGVAATSDTAACMVATLRDVSARKEFEFALAKEKRKLQVTLAAIGDGVITTVADGRVDFVNLAARAMLEIDAADAYGKSIAEVLKLRDLAGTPIDVLRGAREASEGVRGQAQFERLGTRKDLAFVTSPIGEEGYVVVLRDITAAQRLSTRLSYEASHDPLTGTYNRRKFDAVLDDAIGSALHGNGPHALALLDLDRFKRINDNCGHAVGDRVLVDVAQLLQAQLRERDVVARLGGDEFAIVLHDCSRENARRVFDGLRLAVEAYRVEHAGDEYGLGVSIGVAMIDGTDDDAGHLVALADAACYAAKPAGGKAAAS
jgi:diguanylate cyclase (GGDEF)-like protein/PAS domain S-box-containing protein